MTTANRHHSESNDNEFDRNFGGAPPGGIVNPLLPFAPPQQPVGIAPFGDNERRDDNWAGNDRRPEFGDRRLVKRWIEEGRGK